MVAFALLHSIYAWLHLLHGIPFMHGCIIYFALLHSFNAYAVQCGYHFNRRRRSLLNKHRPNGP